MAACSLLPSGGIERRIGKKKSKLGGWHKNSLTEQKIKRKMTKITLLKEHTKRVIMRFLTSWNEMSSPFPSSDPPALASSPSYILGVVSHGMYYLPNQPGSTIRAVSPHSFL